MIWSRTPNAALMSYHDLIAVLPSYLRIVETPFVIVVDLLLFFREIAVRAGSRARHCRRLCRWHGNQRSNEHESTEARMRTVRMLDGSVPGNTMIAARAPNATPMGNHDLSTILP